MKRKNIENNVENKVIGSTWSSTPTIEFKRDGVGALGDLVDPLKNNGVTLIALIITIILMLILVGVVLTLTMGENGLFEMAKYAGKKTNKQAAIEIMNLKITSLEMNLYAEKQRMPTLQELADNLYYDDEIVYINLEKNNNTGIKDKIIVGENTTIYTKLEQYPYVFEINSQLELLCIEDEKIADTTATKIPEGYIKPSGTKLIIENGEYNIKEYEKINVNVPTYEANSTVPINIKSNKVDVSKYQYADTTGLYTKEEAQSGKNIYWHKITQTFPTSGDTMTINLGYIPSLIFINTTDKRGYTYRCWSLDGQTFEAYCIRSNGTIEAMDESKIRCFKLDNDNFIMTVESSTNWNGVNIDIYAMK